MVDGIFIRENEEPGHLSAQLEIDKNEAETLLFDIMPMLKRKYDLLTYNSPDADEMSIMKELLEREVSSVFSNYALSHLSGKKTALIFLIKKISQNITDEQISQLIGVKGQQNNVSLYDKFAASMGINPTHIDDFKFKIMPKIKKYTMTMCKKKMEGESQASDPIVFIQFIIDNVFIDEFENYPFIRPSTDENNQAILPPKAKNIAMKMISAWIKQLKSQKKRN